MKFDDLVKPNLKGVSQLGHEYRVYGIDKVSKSEKWIRKQQKYQWYVLIELIDNGKRLAFKIDYNNKVIEKLTLEQYNAREN